MLVCEAARLRVKASEQFGSLFDRHERPKVGCGRKPGLGRDERGADVLRERQGLPACVADAEIWVGAWATLGRWSGLQNTLLQVLPTDHVECNHVRIDAARQPSSMCCDKRCASLLLAPRQEPRRGHRGQQFLSVWRRCTHTHAHTQTSAHSASLSHFSKALYATHVINVVKRGPAPPRVLAFHSAQAGPWQRLQGARLTWTCLRAATTMERHVAACMAGSR